MTLRTSHFLFALCLLPALTIPSRAQSIISGDVTGTITDPTGAAIPGATVTLTNVNTNVSQTAATKNAGSYRFAFIPPGSYKVDVRPAAFNLSGRRT